MKVSAVPVVLLALVLCLLYGQGMGYPTGAPFKSCANLYPKHSGTQAQSSPSPYDITFSPSYYSPGDEVNVILKDLSGQKKFKGFQLRARRTTGDTEELVGDFIPVSLAIKKQFWYPQEDNYTNCLTHASRDEKDEVVVTWRAPPVSLGDVIFRATFVQDYKTFWVDVESQPLTGNVSNPNSNVDWEVSGSFTDITLDGACGVTKGCLYFPSFCGGSNCNYIVTYSMDNNADEVTFEIKAKSPGYVTLALSVDDKMGNDEAVTCVNKGDYVSVQYGFNPAYYNDRHSIKGFKKISTANKDGYIYCRFTRPRMRSLTHLIESGNQITKVVHTYDLKNPYYIFLAYGNIYAGADVLSKHTELPLVSHGQVDLSQNVIIRAYSMPLNTKIHATLMMLAWMLFALIASATARYLKDGFGGAKNCGIKLWFNLHRGFALLALLLTMAGFILIFVHLKKWAHHATVHGALGVAVMALVLMQILAGLLRPHPGHPLRTLFKNGHGLTALVTLMASAAAIMVAVRMERLNDQLRLWMTIATGAWIGLDAISFVGMEFLMTYKHKLLASVGDQDFMMKEPVTSGFNSDLALTTRDNSDLLDNINRTFHFSYGLYILMLVAVTTANITFIWLF